MEKYHNKEVQDASETQDKTAGGPVSQVRVALLTGGGDKPYAFGLATELISHRVALDIIGSDDLDFREFRDNPDVRFFNLRGDQRTDVSQTRKVIRVLIYYAKLLRYATTSKPMIFHILWNNKFQTFDRTFLMLYYRLLGKKIILTAHNVNAARRDSRDTLLNRLTLRAQYRLADHIFVHTEQMKKELVQEFTVKETGITIIPFGINNCVPNTSLTQNEARERLGVLDGQKAVLFFGNIAPYKGLEYLIDAFELLPNRNGGYRLIIAGCPKNCDEYWAAIRQKIQDYDRESRILLRAGYIPDNETEVYFKAADVLVLPYRFIYQSGVLFLGYSFGLPAIAADVGSLKGEIVEGETGFVFKPEDPTDLARVIEAYFESDLYADLSNRRRQIAEQAAKKHSWRTVGQITCGIYRTLSSIYTIEELTDRTASNLPSDLKAGR